MITTIKTLAILGTLAATAFTTLPAKADHVSIGLGVSVAPARSYYAAPVYVAPAPVTYYTVPTYSYTTTYVAPTYSYAAPTYYYPSTPVYTAPSYYATPTYIYSPAPTYYYSPAPTYYYSRPALDIGFGFNFGGRDHDRGPGPRR
jgi:hypothetical protein